MVKKSEAEVKKELKRLLAEIKVRKEQAEKLGRAFVSPSEEQLIRKIRGETSNSPFFFIQEWDSFTTAGSRCYYIANYTNPDPGLRLCFVTMFFGLAHLDPDINSAIGARDTRWPFVSTQLTLLQPGETGIAEFDYTVPYVPKGTYFGNTVLWGWNPSEDLGTLFDRGAAFYVTLQ
jgi:hypothetical protein